MPLFQLVSATSLSPHTIELLFSEAVPAPVVSVSSLVVQRVILDPNNSSRVLVFTTEQLYTTYVVEVLPFTSIGGSTLDPTTTTADVTGYPRTGRLIGQQVSTTKVRLNFQQSLLETPNLTNPSFFETQTYAGSTFPSSVAHVPGSTVIDLSYTSSLEALSVTVTRGQILNASGLAILPETVVIKPLKVSRSFSVPLSSFSRTQLQPTGLQISDDFSFSETVVLEQRSSSTIDLIESLHCVSDVTPQAFRDPPPTSGLLACGTQGQVFFSPSLTTGHNSSIAVDHVTTCTTPSDTYHFPVDPTCTPLITAGLGVTSKLQESGCISFKGPWLNFTSVNTERLATFADNEASVVETTNIPVTYGGLLNSVQFALFVDPMPSVISNMPQAIPGNPMWDQYDMGTTIAFKTASMAPLPSPAINPKRYWVNLVGETLVTEDVTPIRAMSQELPVTVTMVES